MIDQFDEQVKNWILSVAEGAEVSLAPPNGQKAGSGVGMYLIEVSKASLPHTMKVPAPIQLSVLQSFFLGLSIVLLAQFGDLAESLLKRDGGIKDSNQLPGLGGILDMVDSLIFTTPLLYFFLSLQ